MATKASSAKIETIVALAKRRGFVFASGEIYGGTRSAWDYGPLGVELKENIKRQWWKSMVTGREDVVGLDSSVILPAPGLGRLRPPAGVPRPADRVHQLPQALPRRPARRGVHRAHGQGDARGRPVRRACPNCGTRGQYTAPRDFNMMLKTYLGPVEAEEGLHYLRPETAQGIFVNFLNVQTTSRKKPPFGIGQIGKSFRNEITPGNFIFRTREFEQMEMEFFVEPGTDEELAPVLDRRAHPLVRRPRHRAARTCATTSTRRRSSPTTRSAPSTSSTASASPARSGASSRASPTAPTST